MLRSLGVLVGIPLATLPDGASNQERLCWGATAAPAALPCGSGGGAGQEWGRTGMGQPHCRSP